MISIIVPIYNSSSYLTDCLDSISKQSYSNFEVICVDDGSTDTSRDLCEEFHQKDYRFKYVSQENGGVSKARNTGLKIAKGDYICFIDSDDIIDKDFLFNLLAKITDNDLVICDYTRDRNKLGNRQGKSHRYIAKTFIIDIIYERVKHPNICMMLFKSEIILKKELRFTEGCVRNEDAEFYLKYMSYCDKILWFDYIGYYYRDNQDSAVHKFNLKSLTYIGAAERIKDYLVNRNILDKKCPIVEAAVQYFIYHTAKQGNIDIYDYIHSNYDVKKSMKLLLEFPRRSRKLVALVYLTLGERLFFKILSSVSPK